MEKDLKEDEDENDESENEIVSEESEEELYKDNIKAWADSFAGNKYFDPSDEKMVNLNKKLDENVENFVGFVEDGSDKFRSDIDDYSKSKSMTESYRRLESLAKQYKNENSKYYNDEKLKDIILSGLEWEYNKNYNENSIVNDNWWDYEIGTPRAINNTLSLMYDDMERELVHKYVRPINHFVPGPYQFRVTTGNPFIAKGGNLIDMGRVKIISGFLQNDSEIVNNTIESLKQIYDRKDSNIDLEEEGAADGFYMDGSYVDHTNVAYTGAYGNVMLDGFSQLLPAILFNTNFDKEEFTKIYDIIDKSFLPLLYRTQMLDMVRGRSISREKLQTHDAGAEVIRSILRIAEVSDDEVKDRYNQIIKYITTDNDYYDFSSNLNNFRNIALFNNLTNIELEDFEKNNSINIFNNMDKIVYRNGKRDYVIGFSLHLDKIKNSEYMNGEKSKGWYTSDGAVYLYNNDLSHYSDDYWATVDYKNIPSTTEIKEERDSSTEKKTDSSESLLASDFVGATKLDDNFASIAMDFNNWNNKISLKKSWFILGDRIVFLGSDIKNPSNEEVFTSIENRKIKDGSQYDVYINNDLFELDEKSFTNLKDIFLENKNNSTENIGYYFLDNNRINFVREIREGKWSDVNIDGSDEIKKNSFIKVIQNHDNNKDYAYVMVPALYREEFNKIKDNSGIEIISNNDKCQAVYDKENKIWGVVLYEDEKFKLNEDTELSNKGIYTIRDNGDSYIFSFYDPSEKYNQQLDGITYDIIKNQNTVEITIL